MLTFLIGGARSGKSALAVELGRRHDGAVVYVATSPRIDGDDDLDARIARHQAERPDSWSTIEAEIDLAGAIRSADAAALVIVDCLTVWVGNLLHHEHDESSVLAATDAMHAAIDERDGPVVAISNEVGLGIVPSNDLARRYRDLLGRVNQRMAARADRSLLLVAGRALPLTDPMELLP